MSHVNNVNNNTLISDFSWMSHKRTNEADEDLLQRLTCMWLERWQWKYRELRNPHNLGWEKMNEWTKINNVEISYVVKHQQRIDWSVAWTN